MALRELLASFSIDGTQAEAGMRKLDAGVNGLASKLGGLADAFLGGALLKGLGSFVHGQIEAGDALVDLSTKLGVGADELQKFQYGAGIMGVSAEGAAQALGFLNKNVGEALGGAKEASQTFAGMGVALKNADGSVRETGDLIPELADAFAAMGSQQERTATAMKIFGKSGAQLLPFLQQGREGVEALNKEFGDLGGGLNDDFLQAADGAGDAMYRVNFALSGLKSRLVLSVAPAIERFATRLSKSIAFLTKLTKETRVASLAWGAMGIAAVASLAKVGVGLSKLLGLAPAGGGIFKSLLSLGYLGLIVLAVGALVLIFEDFYTMITGGQSVIGDLLDSLFGVGTSQAVIEAVNAALSEMVEVARSLWPLIQLVGQLFLAIWPYAKIAVTEFAKIWLSTFVTTFKAIVGMIEFASKAFGSFLKLAGGVANAIGGAVGSDALSNVGKSLATAGVGITAATAPKQSAFLGAERPPSGIGDVSQSNTVNVTVQGGSTPRETGQAVKTGVTDALGSQLQNALGALSTGG
jgi:hypothetical protein